MVNANRTGALTPKGVRCRLASSTQEYYRSMQSLTCIYIKQPASILFWPHPVRVRRGQNKNFISTKSTNHYATFFFTIHRYYTLLNILNIYFCRNIKREWTTISNSREPYITQNTFNTIMRNISIRHVKILRFTGYCISS